MMRRPAGAERLLATVLFTDIVGSTELASRLGDRGWKDLVGRHNAIVRAELKRFGGRELDTAGDGFFALFDRPAQAIDCTFAVMDLLAPLGVAIRAGAHLGELEVMNGKVGGMTVHVGARLLQAADRDRIVVTGTVREVTGGSGFTFVDLGVRELKGLPGEWRLYAIDRPVSAPVAVVPQDPKGAPATGSAPAGAARRRAALLLAGAATLLVLGAAAAASLLGSATPPIVPTVDAVVRFDPKGGRVLASIRVGERPAGVALGGGAVWVVSLSDQTVTVIDQATNEVARTPGLPGRPTGIAAGSDSVWISNGFGTAGDAQGAVLRLGYLTKGVDQRIPVGAGVRGIAAGEGDVWVTNPTFATVIRIDEASRGASEPVDVGEAPDPVTVGFGAVWVGDVLGRSIWRLDPGTQAASVAVTLRDPPTAIAAGFDRLWITSTQGNSVSVVDPSTGRLATTLDVGGGPRGVATGAGAVWVAVSARQLVRIDPETFEMRVVAELPGPAEGVAASDEGVWVTVQS